VSDDMRKIEVHLRLLWYNKNVFGVHFGGSLYAMTDPFFALMLTYKLGKNYIVWDKSASIRFIKPGKDTVRAVFELTQNTIDVIHENLEKNQKYIFILQCKITDLQSGETVAEVDKELYVRKKN